MNHHEGHLEGSAEYRLQAGEPKTEFVCRTCEVEGGGTMGEAEPFTSRFRDVEPIKVAEGCVADA